MPLDTAYFWWNGVKYAVTANVDDRTDTVYTVMVWYKTVIPGVAALYTWFEATQARTSLEIAALDTIESLYGINTVLERNS